MANLLALSLALELDAHGKSNSSTGVHEFLTRLERNGRVQVCASIASITNSIPTVSTIHAIN